MVGSALQLLLAVSAATTSPMVAIPLPRHSWSSVSAASFDFGNSATGKIDNATELELKGRFSVAFLDAGTGAGPIRTGCCNDSLPGGGPNCHDACGYAFQVQEEARRLKAVSPTTSTAIYTNAFCTSATFSARTARLVEDHAWDGLWLQCVGHAAGTCNATDKAGAVAWDFRNATARAMFAIEWGSYIAGLDFLDGVYADSGDMMGCNPSRVNTVHNFSLAETEAIFNGTVLAWRAAALELNKAGKWFTVSIKNSFDALGPPDPLFPGAGATCPGGNQAGRRNGGEDIIFELMAPAIWFPFRQYNIPSKDFGKDAEGCVNSIRNVEFESKRGPTFLCCNDANKTADGGAALNVSLAAYLMNANNRSYFGPGVHWANIGWDHVFDEFPQLTRPLGAPITEGHAITDGGYSFTRSFEHLDVTLRCRPSGGRCATHATNDTCGNDSSCTWMPRGHADGACVDRPTASFDWKADPAVTHVPRHSRIPQL